MYLRCTCYDISRLWSYCIRRDKQKRAVSSPVHIARTWTELVDPVAKSRWSRSCTKSSVTSHVTSTYFVPTGYRHSELGRVVHWTRGTSHRSSRAPLPTLWTGLQSFSVVFCRGLRDVDGRWDCGPLVSARINELSRSVAVCGRRHRC